MHYGIGFREQNFRNKLFRTSFLEQASHKLSLVYTLSYCFLSKGLQQQWRTEVQWQWRRMRRRGSCSGMVQR